MGATTRCKVSSLSKDQINIHTKHTKSEVFSFKMVIFSVKCPVLMKKYSFMGYLPVFKSVFLNENLSLDFIEFFSQNSCIFVQFRKKR